MRFRVYTQLVLDRLGIPLMTNDQASVDQYIQRVIKRGLTHVEIISLQFLGQRGHVKMTGKITDLLEDRISLLGFPQFPLRQILVKQFAHFRIKLRFHPLKERTNDKVSAFILNAKS